MTPLVEQTAVVTGAGRGIGAVIARRLAADGATLVLTGRAQQALDHVAQVIRDETGRAALVIPTDSRNEVAVSDLAARVAAELGPVDVLVNNAGVTGPTTPLWEIGVEEWDETFTANVRGVFLTCRAFVGAMVQRRSGSVIMIGSITGKRPLVNRSPYAASKAALIGLTRTLAAEAGPAGVRVNLVSPGAVDGERIRGVISQQAVASGRTEAEVHAEWRSGSPLQRLVQPEEVAAVVAFLASPAASAITGQDLSVANGMVMD